MCAECGHCGGCVLRADCVEASRVWTGEIGWSVERVLVVRSSNGGELCWTCTAFGVWEYLSLGGCISILVSVALLKFVGS